MSNLDILKRLYKNYTRKFLGKILLSVVFSIIVAGSTSSIAWLLDPAIKKIFVERDQDLMILITVGIICAFAFKGAALYFAKMLLIRVGNEITKIFQVQIMNSLIKADTKVIDSKHSGKFISNLTFDVNMIKNLVSTVILNLTKDTLTVKEVAEVCKKYNPKISLKETNDEVPNLGFSLSNKKLLKTGFKPKKTISHAIDEIILAFRNGNLRDEPHFHNLNWMNKMTSDTRELAK